MPGPPELLRSLGHGDDGAVWLVHPLALDLRMQAWGAMQPWTGRLTGVDQVAGVTLVAGYGHDAHHACRHGSIWARRLCGTNALLHTLLDFDIRQAGPTSSQILPLLDSATASPEFTTPRTICTVPTATPVTGSTTAPTTPGRSRVQPIHAVSFAALHGAAAVGLISAA